MNADQAAYDGEEKDKDDGDGDDAFYRIAVSVICVPVLARKHGVYDG